jgi:radical SAM protein (TIGR01212 family)
VVRTKRRRGIKICVHIILGLPGESKEEMLETAKTLTALHVDGVKIHSAHVLKGTRLEEMYRSGEYRIIELPEYVDLVCDFLEYLSPKIVIHRLIGDAPRNRYVAPEWCLHKSDALIHIDLELERRNSWQGKRLHVHQPQIPQIAQINKRKKSVKSVQSVV